MKHDRLQLILLFATCVGVVWFFGLAPRPWEVLLLGAGFGLGVAATLAMVLVRTGWVRADSAWGEGSLFRVAQGLGVALLTYGAVRSMRGAFIVGALLFAVGSIVEIRQARLKRRT